MAATTTALVGVSAPAVAQSEHGGHGRDHGFKQVNLVSDIAGLAQLTDPLVKNPWGVAFGPSTPLWVSNQFSNTVTLYSGATAKTPKVTKLGLVVKADSPTGMVFNPTKQFQITQGGKTAPANFLFNENKDVFSDNPVAEVTGWSGASSPTPTTTVVKARKPGSVHVGLALVPGTYRHGPRLLAANAVTGGIDVYDSRFRPTKLGAKAFVDPKAAAQKALAYNVTYLRGRVYVAYSPAGPKGVSALSVFTAEGKFVKRLATGGHLASPWGMAIAPRHWGQFGGALLVGNVDDGIINAYNRRSGRWLGALEDEKGKPLVNLGLWGLQFGNGVIGTPNTLIFAAGIGDEVDNPFAEVYEHGLIGAITPVRHRHY